MKISEILQSQRPSISFEVFPPKASAPFEPIAAAVEQLCDQRPAFMSVTYGAGGGANANTLPIAKRILAKGITPLAHLTCLTSTRERIQDELAALKAAGIENILALRGDRPADSGPTPGCYAHASDLAADIRRFGGFAVGGGLLLVVLLYEKLRRVDAMGGGDLKLLFLTGLYLGWLENLLCLLLACLIGIITALAVQKRRRQQAPRLIPWGPSIAAAAILTLLFGDAVTSAYLSLF